MLRSLVGECDGFMTYLTHVEIIAFISCHMACSAMSQMVQVIEISEKTERHNCVAVRFACHFVVIFLIYTVMSASVAMGSAKILLQ